MTTPPTVQSPLLRLDFDLMEHDRGMQDLNARLDKDIKITQRKRSTPNVRPTD